VKYFYIFTPQHAALLPAFYVRNWEYFLVLGLKEQD